MTEPQIFKGLAGVTADTTAVSKVNPETNSLLYRGYPVQELAAAVDFEDVAWLLWYGELPSESEAQGFRDRERASRALAENVKAARVKHTPELIFRPDDVSRGAARVEEVLRSLHDDES